MSYTKQGFKAGMKLQHTHLINMEDGIINATSTQIPSHWQAYMDEKVNQINTLNEMSGGASDTFIFISDTHYPEKENGGHNNGESIALMKYIIENTSVDKIFFGGDMIHPSSSEIGLKAARDLQKALSGIKYYSMRGNHDADYNNANQYYDILYRPQSDYCEMSTSLDYYVDNKVQKIRYIVMDTIYGHEDTSVTTPSQIEWMKERILELDEHWTVLVMRHSIWNAAKNSPVGDPNVDARLVIDALDSIYDNAKCRIAGILAGHCHCDNYELTDKGYALIVNTCDCCDYVTGYDLANPTRPIGTTQGQSFDVVNFNPTTGVITTIRIGAGTDRKMNYSIPKNYLDLSSLTWEQGHFDKTGAFTGESNPNYNYRLRSNVFDLPVDVIGKTLYFELKEGFDVNIYAGTESNPYEFNYYYINSSSLVADSGVNSSCRGYAITFPNTVTHIRMMVSYDDGIEGSLTNRSQVITLDEVSSANFKIWY